MYILLSRNIVKEIELLSVIFTCNQRKIVKCNFLILTLTCLPNNGYNTRKLNIQINIYYTFSVICAVNVCNSNILYNKHEDVNYET